MDAFNLAVGTMQQNELAILASVCGSVESSEACDGHAFGHICATIDADATCGIASDVSVALEYCQNTPEQGGAGAGTPESSVYGICMQSTSDADALNTICLAEGVSVTAHMICSGLGYSSGTCDDVAEIAVGSFGSGEQRGHHPAQPAGYHPPGHHRAVLLLVRVHTGGAGPVACRRRRALREEEQQGAVEAARDRTRARRVRRAWLG